MSTVNAVKVIAEALAKHQWRGSVMGCGCGWNWAEPLTYCCGEDKRIERAHVAHQASVIASLPDIAIVDRTRAWYVMRDGQFVAGGRPIAGPFNTQADASAARRALEHSESHGDYWLDSKPTLAAAVGES